MRAPYRLASSIPIAQRCRGAGSCTAPAHHHFQLRRLPIGNLHLPPFSHIEKTLPIRSPHACNAKQRKHDSPRYSGTRYIIRSTIESNHCP
ncbi:hypothetical protein BDV39DRAFT_170287 [Aspergillus sergii]|uniref:Uncharacterized protein n=1 Tax=Aspergillus sergii TaxID=1034303 RepID=A0A5N6XB73_9EURO|nr:hypothetical protein BDV39DRAFT_170287 [Aspergillus sergii]